MPPDTREKEKIIGGMFNIRQFCWICLGVGLYAVIGLSTYRLLGALMFIIGIPLPCLGFLFALKKVEDMPLPTYLRLKMIYNRKTKYYVNAGYKDSLFFTADLPKRRRRF